MHVCGVSLCYEHSLSSTAPLRYTTVAGLVKLYTERIVNDYFALLEPADAERRALTEKDCTCPQVS